MTPEESSASFQRRLAFAGDSRFFFSRLSSWRPISRFALLGRTPIWGIPGHLARLGFDLVECLRTASRVPGLGDVESALLDRPHPVRQHPRYRAFWYDAAKHSMVGIHVGTDLIRHQGKYFLVENNHGPSLYHRRRKLYDSAFDPLVSSLAAAARKLGFSRVVPITFRWKAFYLEEFERAGQEYGVSFTPMNCPLVQPGVGPRMVALPASLEADTMYVIHAGLMTSVTRYVSDKWYTSKWLVDAIENELPADSLLTIPRTHDRLDFPLQDNGPRWPNLVIKLAGSDRSLHVIAGRFDDEADARQTLGLDGGTTIPRKLRLGFAKSLLFGHDRIVYQTFIPPELDNRGRAQLIRLHSFVSPLCSEFVSAHLRVSLRRIPERVPRGIIAQDNTFIFKQSTITPVSPEMEAELRQVAAHLAPVIRNAIARTFETAAENHS